MIQNMHVLHTVYSKIKLEEVTGGDSVISVFLMMSRYLTFLM
jgi:hypothetical protein